MQHILDLLPLELRTDGRDLRRELKESMQWQTPRPEDGLTYVMQRCKLMVEDVQKADVAPKPTFVANNLDLGDLAYVTGMCLTHGPTTTRELSAGGFLADDKKYCEKCPHKGMCWRDPNFSGTIPVGVWANESARKQIFEDKAKNAKEMGVPNKRITAPPKSKLEEYNKNKASRGGRPRAGGANTAAVAFMDGLVDINDPAFGAQMGAVSVAVPTPTPIGALRCGECEVSMCAAGMQCGECEVLMCAAGMPELEPEQNDAVQTDSHEQELEEADCIWHVASQAYAMTAVDSGSDKVQQKGMIG